MKVKSKKTFCGRNSGAIVNCPPGQCGRKTGLLCLREVPALLDQNREELEKLLEGILRDCGPLTPAGVLAVGTNRFGGNLGSLLSLFAERLEVAK